MEPLKTKFPYPSPPEQKPYSPPPQSQQRTIPMKVENGIGLGFRMALGFWLFTVALFSVLVFITIMVVMFLPWLLPKILGMLTGSG